MNSTPYWFDSASLPTARALKADHEVDVAIVGGGLTGITAASLLKAAGKRVALLERGRCAQVDTGHTTAHLTCVIDTRYHQLIKTFGADAARAVWDAGAAALDQIARLVRHHAIACDFQWTPGHLHQPLDAADEHSERELRTEIAALHELGIKAEYRERLSGLGVAGIRFPHQALFHPQKYLAGLLRTIPGGGSHVFEETNVDEVQDDLTLKVGRHHLRCGAVVLATHNPIMGNENVLSALMFQTKLALYTSYAMSATVPSGELPEGLFWDTGEPYFYLRVERRTGHDFAILGGADHKTGQETDTAGPYLALEERFRALAPGLRIDHRWCGQVIESNDGLPFIGEIAPHQHVATGFAGNGMTFGTLGGMMAADAILGRPNPWRELFDPHRRTWRGGVWNYLRENKDYPFYAVRDRFAGPDVKSPDLLAADEGGIVRVNGEKVAAYRDASGRLHFCSPVCTHLGGIVKWNEAERTWDCPCHGARFTATGEVLSGPAEEPLEKIPAAVALKRSA